MCRAGNRRISGQTRVPIGQIGRSLVASRQWYNGVNSSAASGKPRLSSGCIRSRDRPGPRSGGAPSSSAHDRTGTDPGGSGREIPQAPLPRYPVHWRADRPASKSWRFGDHRPRRPQIGGSTEAELIAGLVARIAELQPRLVTSNGTAFDLPVLRYRAMLHGFPAPGRSCRPYFHRLHRRCHGPLRCALVLRKGQGDTALDLQDVRLRGEGQRHRGSQVERLVSEDRITAVASYCLEDVVNTYRIWLVHELVLRTPVRTGV
jgi:hypothetical protein